MSKIYKKLQQWFYKPYMKHYLKKDRQYRWNELNLFVKSGVFHPGVFYSSKYLASYINSLKITGKSFLEVGCGSGLISLVAAQNGANVTAIDISESAVQNTKVNFEKNSLRAQVVHSDLFNSLAPDIFDFIVINPPYYPKDVNVESEYAWNCGSEYEYFKRLFQEVGAYINERSQFLMILSDECDLMRIKSIAKDNGYHFELVNKQKIHLEWNYIYSIVIADKNESKIKL